MLPRIRPYIHDIVAISPSLMQVGMRSFGRYGCIPGGMGIMSIKEYMGHIVQTDDTRHGAEVAFKMLGHQPPAPVRYFPIYIERICTYNHKME